MQLDINKILELIFIEFDKNPTEWILFGCLIVLLLVFFVLRLVFFSSKDVVARKGKPSILNSIENVEEKDLSLPLGFIDTNKSNSGENFNLNSGALDDNSNSTVNEYLYLDDNSLIEELTINGVKVKHATAHHAKYIVDNKIGPGAILDIVRSGDVIPYIVNVIEPSEQPQMPNIDYKWNDTKVNIIASNLEENEEHKMKTIISFVTTIGIENLGYQIDNIQYMKQSIMTL